MDWNHPPAWFMVLLWGIPLAIIAAVMGLAWARREKPRCTVYGLRVYADKGLEVPELEDQVRRLLDIFEDCMAPGAFPREGYRDHLTLMKAYLRADMLRSDRTVGALRALTEGLEIPLYTGLTHSATVIEVACAESLRVAGVVVLSRTAFLYELMNAMIWALDPDGVYVAYAESFLDPEDPAHWRWLQDVDGDGDVDEVDVRTWQARRRVYEDRFTSQVSPQVARLLTIH